MYYFVGIFGKSLEKMVILTPKLNSVLIVDDDRVICGVTQAFFEKQGITEVFTAKNGVQALEILDQRNNDIDLIVCDLQMPEIDGIQFLRHLHDCDYKGAVSILSGVDGSVISLAQSLANTHKLNIVGALQKPINFDDIKNLLRNISGIPLDGDCEFEPLVSESEFRTALAEEQIKIYYQPQLDVHTDKVVAAEALARWDHPKHGIITPNHFIEMAEEHKLIEPLTDFVLRTIIADAKRWKRLKINFKTSVNLSVSNLSNLDFPDKVASMMDQSGLDRSRLVLEITESRLLANDTVPMEVLARLAILGFELSIDDFGTAYSNIEYLRDFPFSELKIDKSFITDAHKNAQSRAIVEACVKLSRDHNVRIVAEGVETIEDLKFVAEQGVDLVQGYFSAKPMPINELLNWYLNHRGKYDDQEQAHSFVTA